ncbi:hypothetical protein L1987_01509 [Smallanthus sonchifolius]|uniref:Uncharacterized protein n=1 Tax=Smallanthus sonchifolius TaxID=185202 RepID=A0ACB9K5F2_9ASTR|nr:hypothetical protein L1987_01509 [Smallanthus sonchifolius]
MLAPIAEAIVLLLGVLILTGSGNLELRIKTLDLGRCTIDDLSAVTEIEMLSNMYFFHSFSSITPPQRLHESHGTWISHKRAIEDALMKVD